MFKYLSPVGVLIFCLCIGFGNRGFAQQKVDTDARYKVVVNHEEQYSIVPVGYVLPKKIKETKINGSLSSCQAYIEEVWTDMRPLSIRKLDLNDDTRYSVVINHEEQYSILPSITKLKKNQKAVKKELSFAACQAYIEEVWTDMRPLSLRKDK